MGRAYESDELDRPDLNKCPDCGCLFASDNCPLCGKECPEEWRAGNRKAVKKKKASSAGTGRVTFVEWYHSWWFILIMLFFMPIVGIILLATSPHKKGLKLTVISVAVIYTVLSYVGVGSIISAFKNKFSEPVDTSYSKTEYIELCGDVTAEELYRMAESYNDKFVTATLRVKAKYVDSNGYYNGGEHNTYYMCEDLDGNFEVLVRDCIQDTQKKFIPGDIVTVYGEGAGELTIYDLDYVSHSASCIYAAYMELN